MKFWILKANWESKYAGKVLCLNQAVAHQLSAHSYPKNNPTLKFELESRSKFSDFISPSSITATGLLINQKVKSILDKHNLPDHKYFEANIESSNGKQVETYYWLHIFNPSSLDWINYKESVFFYTKYGFREGNITFNSFKESRIKKEQLVGNMGTIEVEEIVLNSNFDKTLDLFNFEYFDHAIHISSRLKEALESENLTGLEIKRSNCC